jgi:type I restriction enzyme S subunit
LLDLEGKEGVEMKKLGEVANFVKDKIEASFLNSQNYVSVENLLKDKAGRIDSENVPFKGNWSCYKHGDVLIGNIRPYLRKIWLADRKGGTNGDVLIIRPNEFILPQFLYCVLASEKFFEYYNQTAKGGKMPRGEKSRALSYTIPLPPLSEQQRIVSILDTFEQSIANLEEQLAMREKQYEYYRNQLLTFEGEEERGKT